MKRGYKVLVLGNGRIARAATCYLQKNPSVSKVVLEPCQSRIIPEEKNIAKYDLLIGALPGELGQLPLQLALRHRKNLIDISDVEPQVYIKKSRQAAKKGITIIPCCGFGPGLINFILGRELSKAKGVREVEIKAGSLSPLKNYYPFLWCFEDLILEHRIPSWQILNGKIKKFKPFDGYQKERFFGIEAESYFAQSGFENMMQQLKVNYFAFRVVRPLGFREFFGYLESEGFLKKETMPVTKNIVEKDVLENITLSTIRVSAGKKKATWILKSVSRKGEKLNSMQKITAATPAAMAETILKGKVGRRGVVFMEDLASDEVLFRYLLKENKKAGVTITRQAG